MTDRQKRNIAHVKIGKMSETELNDIAEESYRQITGRRQPTPERRIEKMRTTLFKIIGDLEVCHSILRDIRGYAR